MEKERSTSEKLQAICDDTIHLIFNSEDSVYDRLEALENIAYRVNMMVAKLEEKIEKDTSVANIKVDTSILLHKYHNVSNYVSKTYGATCDVIAFAKRKLLKKDPNNIDYL